MVGAHCALMSHLAEIRAEMETLRLFILRFRDTDEVVRLDGELASPEEIAHLKEAIARFGVLSLELRRPGGFDT